MLPSALLSCTARNGALSRRHQPNIITHKLRPGYRNITKYLKRHMKEWGHARLKTVKWLCHFCESFTNTSYIALWPMVYQAQAVTQLHFQHTLPAYTNNESPKGKHQNNNVCVLWTMEEHLCAY